MDDSSTQFKFKTEIDPYPWLRPISYMFFVAGLGLIIIKISLAAPLLIIGIIFNVGMKNTKVLLDVAKKTVTTQSGFSKQTIHFEKCDAITITKRKMSQNISSRARSTTLHYSIYQAHISIDGENVLLAENRDGEELMEQLAKPANMLRVNIET